MKNTKIGDIFSATIDGNKRHFQLIAFDQTQLNSDVIRVFKRIYPATASPDASEIVSGEVDFYVHCPTKPGLKMGLWEKIGNTKEIGDTTQIIFRNTNDYGYKEGQTPIKVSQNWHIWRINDMGFTKVGALRGEHRKSYVGLVINPLGIVELLKGNKYPLNYPEFE